VCKYHESGGVLQLPCSSNFPVKHFSSRKGLRLGTYNCSLFDGAQDEGIATVIKNYHRYLYRSLTDTQASVSYLWRMPWAAA